MSTSTTLQSNAFNFMDFIQSQVDPRTGQYTCAISLPELNANKLCGPVVPLQLAFNPLNGADSGFGKGWNLQLSQFSPLSGILALYTGETFKVILGRYFRTGRRRHYQLLRQDHQRHLPHSNRQPGKRRGG